MENDAQAAKPGKTGTAKTAIFVVGVLAAATALSLAGRKNPNQYGCLPPRSEPGTYEPQSTAPRGDRPRLLDLGATTCIPCKKMAPVLDELRTEYEGRLDVQFVDVWRTPGVADQYGVQSIPTQIFFDASGKELYRHQGFFSKEDILSKWDELGVDLKK